jgi:hypothetical protein
MLQQNDKINKFVERVEQQLEEIKSHVDETGRISVKRFNQVRLIGPAAEPSP